MLGNNKDVIVNNKMQEAFILMSASPFRFKPDRAPSVCGRLLSGTSPGSSQHPASKGILRAKAGLAVTAHLGEAA